MAKSKKKKSEADFQKVKLKVGKSRPSGTNATDSSFRTSQIQLNQQLQVRNEPTTNKNLSLKDLLGQLNHYNATIRHEALLGIRDLFSDHPDVMNGQVSVWLSKVLSKCTDSDPAVRHSLHLLSSHALRRLSTNQISPFMRVIVAHICCGMTHIDEAIQLDALNVLDLLVEVYPKLFISHSEKVLSNFVDLIAKQSSKETNSAQSLKGTKVVKGITSTSSRESGGSSTKAQMTSLKTRTRILEKLNKILRVVQQQHGALVSVARHVGSVCEDVTSKTVAVEAGKPTFTPLFKYGRAPREPSTMKLNDILERSSKNTVDAGDVADYGSESTSSTSTTGRQFAETIFPVLVNCWVEYNPSQLVTGMSDGSSLGAALAGFNVVIESAELLLSLLDSDDLSPSSHSRALLTCSFFKEFVQYFIHYFPLPVDSVSSSSHSAVRPKSINGAQQLEPSQTFIISFNFFIARVLCNLCLELAEGGSAASSSYKFDSRQHARWVKQLIVFVTTCLDGNVLPQTSRCEEFVKIIQDVIRLKSLMKREDGISIDIAAIMKSLLKVYTRASLKSSVKLPIINFFLQMLSQARTSGFLTDTRCRIELESFMLSIAHNLGSLPSSSLPLLRESIAFVKSIVVWGVPCERFTDTLQLSIIKLTDGKSIYRSLGDDLQKSLVEILYYLPTLSEEVLRSFCCQLHSNHVDVNMKRYILNIVSYCAMSKPKPSITPESFISFILSSIIGYSLEELKELNARQPNLISWNILNIFRCDLRKAPVEVALQKLKLLKNYDKLWQYIMKPIANLLVMMRSIPVSSAVGLVKLLESLWLWHDSSSDSVDSERPASEMNQVADLISSVLLYSVSETYKQLNRQHQQPRTIEDEGLEDDLICSSITLLKRSGALLRLLLQKWTHVLTEYSMEVACVNSVGEVLVCLLQDSDNLHVVLQEQREPLAAITRTLTQVKGLNSSIRQDLQYHSSLLH